MRSTAPRVRCVETSRAPSMMSGACLRSSAVLGRGLPKMSNGRREYVGPHGRRRSSALQCGRRKDGARVRLAQ
jgi:hypothetical protein